jgi:ATP-dependent Lhr-like helicase
MKEILVEETMDPRWTERSRNVLEYLRAEHHFLRDGEEFVHGGDEEITWYTFAGGGANLLLARLLERELGGRVISRNTSITLTKAAGKSRVAVDQAIERLREAGSPTWEDAMEFAPSAARTPVSKFQPCLPDELARDLIVRKTIDVPGARRAVGLSPTQAR